MKHHGSQPSFAETPASSDATFLLLDPDRTIQMSLPPSGESSVRVTPGGMHRDWRLARHFATGLLALSAVLGLLARQPVSAPVKAVRIAPTLQAIQQPILAAPAPVYTPPPPVMYQAPPVNTQAPRPEIALPPPSNAARVEAPLAWLPARNAGLLNVPIRPGFAVPPAVPMPSDGSFLP